MRCGFLLCLIACTQPAAAELQWTLGDGRARPGETGFVEVRVRHDGVISGADRRIAVTFDSERLALPDSASAIDAMSGFVCERRNAHVLDVEMVRPPPPGAESVACRVSVRAAAGSARAEAGFRAFVTPCIPATGCAAVATGIFTIEGPAHWRDRALFVMPADEAPSTAQIVGFDYAAGAGPAPLRMFDAPRPANVASIFAQLPVENAYGKGQASPNAAVAQVLRAVRAIYVDEASRRQGEQSALSDPAVAGVTAQVDFGLRTWPTMPRAGEPFALWLTTSLCDPIRPLHFEDREVVVTDERIEVATAYRPMLEINCGGTGAEQRLLNLAGVPAGEYRLALSATPDDGGDAQRYEIALTVSAQGSASATTARAVPAGSPLSVASLVLLLVVLAARYSRRMTNCSTSGG